MNRKKILRKKKQKWDEGPNVLKKENFNYEQTDVREVDMIPYGFTESS